MAASRLVEVTDEKLIVLKKMHIFQIIINVIILKQLFTSDSVNIGDDYMVLSHKDWELPNSRI